MAVKQTVKNKTIFVQIAAYRDPELLNTIKDCLDKAKYPQKLQFGIGWQHSPYEEWDTLDEYKNNPQFTILDVDYRDARGPCWIRHQINNLYNNQQYTLQIDSHHRFATDWDVTLINMLESLRSAECPRPMLTSYLPSFNPKNDPEARLQSPWIMEFDRFAPEGAVHFMPRSIDNYKELSSPVPARFASGHFIFADGTFVRDVPYDPTYYFHGEEINLSVRSYMAGYDLFAPHKVFMWHEYTREGKSKHWDDHSKWVELEKESHKHNRELLGIDTTSDKTLQKHRRTLKEYERYAGIEFATRRVHKQTLIKKFPPVSITESEHSSQLVNYHKVCIDLYRPLFTEDDYIFWAVAFEDEHGNEIIRKDVTREESQRLLSVPLEQDKFIHIWREFYSDRTPVRWVVWPESESKGFMNRLTGEFKK
jgi:hypothetical protein